MSRSFRPVAGLRWSVEKAGLLFHHPDRGVFCGVAYPYAAIWDLLHRGREWSDVVRLTSQIAGLPPSAAAELVESALRGWRGAGLLESADG